LPGATPIRVLVVEDNETWRRFYSTALRKHPELQVVGEVSDGVEAIEKAKGLKPDLILLDIGLPTLNGIEAARRIREVSSASNILFVSENRSPDIVNEALSTGAGGYVLKSDASQLFPAVQAIIAGKRFLSTSFAGHDLVTSDTTASEGSNRSEYNPYLRLAENATIPEFLLSAIAATAADFGTLQLFDSKNRVLRLVAQHGFETEFLEYFDTVTSDKKCVCGAAMGENSRVIVTDVVTDPLFSNQARDVLLRANVRSVQATPLVGSQGKLVGMVSTHYRCPSGATPDVWKQIDDLVASFLAEIDGLAEGAG
jgi:DNA-binding NarL/FixJ family response regulator